MIDNSSSPTSDVPLSQAPSRGKSEWELECSKQLKQLEKFMGTIESLVEVPPNGEENLTELCPLLWGKDFKEMCRWLLKVLPHVLPLMDREFIDVLGKEKCDKAAQTDRLIRSNQNKNMYRQIPSLMSLKVKHPNTVSKTFYPNKTQASVKTRRNTTMYRLQKPLPQTLSTVVPRIPVSYKDEFDLINFLDVLYSRYGKL